MSTSSALPDWLATPSAVVVPNRHQHRFLRRSLARAEQLTSSLLPDEELLGRWDPRVKLVTSLVVLIVLALLHSPWTLTIAAVALVALAGWHRVIRSLAVIAGPVLVMSLALLTPATLSLVRPGTVVVPLWSGQGLTAQGLWNAWIVLARVLACTIHAFHRQIGRAHV